MPRGAPQPNGLSSQSTWLRLAPFPLLFRKIQSKWWMGWGTAIGGERSGTEACPADGGLSTRARIAHPHAQGKQGSGPRVSPSGAPTRLSLLPSSRARMVFWRVSLTRYGPQRADQTLGLDAHRYAVGPPRSRGGMSPERDGPPGLTVQLPHAPQACVLFREPRHDPPEHRVRASITLRLHRPYVMGWGGEPQLPPLLYKIEDSLHLPPSRE